MKGKMSKSSLIILIVVGVIVLAIVGYGIWQATGGTGRSSEESFSNVSTISDRVELNDENLNGTWERTDGAVIHYLTFSDNQKLTYEKFENGSDTAVLTSTDGSYEISDNKVTIFVSADGDTVTETYEAVLSRESLILKAASEQSGFFAGNYKRSEQREEPSSAPENSYSEPESTIVSESYTPPEPESSSSEPESAAPPESTAPPESESNQISVEQLSGAWEAEAPYEGNVFFFQLNFLSENEVRYVAGWAGSEISYEGICAYSLEGDLLHIRVPLDAETRESTYKLLLYENSLTMVYVSGDPLNIVQGDGSSLAYHRI